MKRIKKIDYFQYRVRKFSPTLYSEPYSQCGCGAAALSTILNIHPLLFISPDKLNKNDWPDWYMVKQLRKYGYSVIKLNPLEISNVELIEDVMTPNHIILISQHYNKYEASWAVIYDNLYIHGFKVVRFQSYELLSRPLITSYIIYHPKLA